MILGFNTRIDPIAQRQANRLGIEIELYTVIYHLVDDVSKALTGMLEPIYEDRLIGKAEVRAIFRIKGRGRILGCLVLDGTVRRDAPAKVFRHTAELYSSRVSSLKRFQEDVPEVRMGYECGIGIEGFNNPKEGDVIEVYERVRVR